MIPTPNTDHRTPAPSAAQQQRPARAPRGGALSDLRRRLASPLPQEIAYADYRHQIHLGLRARQRGEAATGNLEAGAVAAALALWCVEERRRLGPVDRRAEQIREGLKR